MSPSLSTVHPLGEEIPGFVWPILSFFRDALHQYTFTHGDTIYRTLSGYQSGSYKGEWVMVRTAKRSKPSEAIKIQTEDGEDQNFQEEDLPDKWKSPIGIDFYHNQNIQRFEVTQGHLYTLLWKGESAILSCPTLPPYPPRSTDLLKLLRVSQNKNKPYYQKEYAGLLADQTVREALPTLSSRLNVLMGQSKSSSYFCVPFDVVDSVSVNKHNQIVNVLSRILGARSQIFTSTDLNVPHSHSYIPTTRIGVVEISTIISHQKISDTLKPYLYILNPAVPKGRQRFSLNKHGILIDHV